MSQFRYDRILGGTALALILAAPLGGLARDASRIAAAPLPVSPAETVAVSPAAPSAAAPVAPAAATPAEQSSTPTPPAGPAVTMEPTVVPDPMASLDPADRVIAEKIRDLVAAPS